MDDCNEPVQFGDDIELHYSGGGVDKGLFQEVAINKGPVSILSFVGVSHARDYRYDSECDVLKRPAPDVLLGDGKPVSKGETVYVIESGIERTVSASGTQLCEGMDGWDGSPWVMFGNGSWMHARDLTHERPVLGADGKPIKVGETVYPIDGEWLGIPLEVLGIELLSVKVSLLSGKGWTMFGADHLTHEEPDTQERIDEDAVKGSNDYWGCHGYECLQCPSLLDGENPCERYSTRTDCRKAMTLDLLRRQRELDKRTGGAE